MIKTNLNILLFLLSFSVAGQMVTEQMVETERARCPAPYLVAQIDTMHRQLDSLSVSEIHELFSENVTYFKGNKQELLSRFQENIDNEEKRFASLIKKYTATEEQVLIKENILPNLVNTNHLNYRDTVQAGVFFRQTFEDGKSLLAPVVRNNGATVFMLRTETQVNPFYRLNSDSEQDLTIEKIYYHHEKEQNVPIPIEGYSFPLNPMAVPKMKHVDSIQMRFDIRYLTKVDTVHFTKKEIGVQKGDVKLLQMDANFIAYELPYNYYMFYKGKVLEEAYYNKKGERLEEKFGLSNNSNNTAIAEYDERLASLEKIADRTKGIQDRQVLYRTLEYLELKRTNAYLRSKVVNKQAVEGNVDSFTLYLENRRDSISFSAMLRNRLPDKKLYDLVLEDKTEFRNKAGALQLSIPFKVKFVNASMNVNRHQVYFYKDGERHYEKTYYSLDSENKTYQKLPYSEIQFLCPAIVWAKHPEKNGLQLLSSGEHKLLSEKVFINYSYGDVIEVYTEEGTFYLLNQNGQPISIDTKTKVTAIRLEKK